MTYTPLFFHCRLSCSTHVLSKAPFFLALCIANPLLPFVLGQPQTVI